MIKGTRKLNSNTKFCDFKAVFHSEIGKFTSLRHSEHVFSHTERFGKKVQWLPEVVVLPYEVQFRK